MGRGIPVARAVGVFLFLFLLFFGFAVYVLVTVSVNSQFAQYGQKSRQSDMVFIRKQIDSFLADRIEVLRGYARFPEVKQAVMLSGENDHYIADFMSNLSVLGQRYQIVLLDFEGMVIHRTAESPVFDYQNSICVQKIVEEELAQFVMVSRSPTQAFWRLCVPVLLNGVVEGGLVLEIPIGDLGNVLHFSESMEHARLTLAQDGDELISFGGLLVGESTTLELDDLNLSLFYRNDYSSLSQVRRSLMLGFTLVLPTIVMITILCALILAKRAFVVPLEQLRQGTGSLIKGCCEISAPMIQRSSGIREIETLRRDFSAMAQTLFERESQLLAARDNLERRVVERTRDLKESHERMASILQTIQSGIMVVDPERREIVETNTAAETILGLERDQIIGKPYGTFTIWGRMVECPSSEPYEGYENEEEVMIASDGRHVTVLKTVELIIYNGCTHLLESFVDISDRKAVERALAASRKKEVGLAAHIQESLLLGRPPPILGSLLLAAASIPSQGVDGDLYDFLKWERYPGRLDMIIGDVMGKGVQAALIGAGTKSGWLHSLVSLLEQEWEEGIPPIQAIVDQLHLRVVPELIAVESFITFCYARFDVERKRFEYVHCGHTEIIYWCAAEQRCHLLEGNHPPLGMLQSEQYTAEQLSFGAGDCFVFYSDGVTETENEQGEMFGIERLCELVKTLQERSAEAMVKGIEDGVRAFCGSGSYADDLSCIVVKETEGFVPPVLGV